MARRRGYKKGDWLVKDEESGFTTYGTKVACDYYGVLKVKDQCDKAHPQMFVRAKEDPYPVYPVSPPFREYDLTESVVGFHVGTTNVPTVDGPALHLYRPGVNDAVVEYDTFVNGPIWTPQDVLQGMAPTLWLDAESLSLSDGAPVSSWASVDAANSFTQATSSKMPTYRQNGINGRPAVDFDGGDILVSSPFITGFSGTLIAVYQPTALPIGRVFGGANEINSTFLGFTGSNGSGQFGVNTTGGGLLSSVSAISAGVVYCATYMSNAVKYTLRLNGVNFGSSAGTANHNWFSDIVGISNHTIGGQKTATEGAFLNGKISEILVYSSQLSYESLSTVSGYIASKYGVQV